MKVSVEDIPTVPVNQKGILIRIRDDSGKNVGKLWIGNQSVRWARGNTPDIAVGPPASDIRTRSCST